MLVSGRLLKYGDLGLISKFNTIKCIYLFLVCDNILRK